MTGLAVSRRNASGRALDWIETHGDRIGLGAVLLGLLVAGGYALVLGDQLRYLDEQVYLQLTRSLAEGHGYRVGTEPTAYRPPGYPLLLLPVHLATGGSVLAMRWVAVLCLGGAVWFTYLLGRRTGSAAVGAVAAVALACYPLVIYTATTLYPQIPALLLLLVMVEFGLRTQDDGVRRRWLCAVVSGMAGGLLTVTVPSFAPSIAVLVGWLAWRAGRCAARGVALRAASLLLVAAAVIPGGWCIRNAVQLHAFVPVSTNNGVNLLLGNNPNATPSSGTNADISAYDWQAKDMRLGEVAIDHFYGSAAMDWISAHPLAAMRLYAGKVAHNFAYRDTLKTSGQGASDLLAALTYYPVLAAAVLRVLLLRRFPPSPVERLMLWLIVVNVLLLAVFFTRVRFRVPLDALTIVLAVSAVVHLWQAGSRNELTTIEAVK